MLFIIESCPYCRKAATWMNELLTEHPEYRDIEVEVIDENAKPDFAAKYDYYYVPTYYVDGVKVHEGAATREIVDQVYQKALS